jgi:hypothetical protein
MVQLIHGHFLQAHTCIPLLVHSRRPIQPVHTRLCPLQQQQQQTIPEALFKTYQITKHNSLQKQIRSEYSTIHNTKNFNQKL